MDGAYNLARYLTRDPSLSEDVLQDSFERAFRSFHTFRGDSARAWLFAIVRNCCHSALAAERSRVVRMVVSEAVCQAEPESEQAGFATMESPEEAFFRQEEATRVQKAIEDLPEPFREAIVLRELEELSYKEIAHITGVAMGTVMSRLSRGRTLLSRVFLDEQADPAPASVDIPR